MAWPDYYDVFFNQVRGLKAGKPGHWNGICPAHEDQKPSLSIDISDTGALLFVCMAGCTHEQIRRAMNLENTLLAPPETKTPRKQIVATYDYRDLAGNLVCQTVRFEPKDFRQRRPNPEYKADLPEGQDNEKWVWDLKGVKRVLYRTPDIAAAIRDNPARRIVVVEGEKDADTLWSLGFIATTNPMGALKWDDSYSDQLRSANVVVVPDEDNDKHPDQRKGLHHADQVCKSLKGKAASVVIARVPCQDGVKADVTSWLMAMPDDAARKEAFKALVTGYAAISPADALSGKRPEKANGTPTAASAASKQPEAAKDPQAYNGHSMTVIGRVLYVATRLASGCPVEKADLLLASDTLRKLAEELA